MLDKKAQPGYSFSHCVVVYEGNRSLPSTRNFDLKRIHSRVRKTLATLLKSLNDYYILSHRQQLHS